jgi:uncharacterized spore protein YtfJ
MDFTTATDELVREVTGIPKELGASACFGEAVERDGHTLIPVARVNFGYGLGFGGGSDTHVGPSTNGVEDAGAEGGGGGGGGGGGSSTPVAIIDISDRGVEIKAIEDKTRIIIGGLMLAAWNVFWLSLTARTFFHQRAKVKKLELGG